MANLQGRLKDAGLVAECPCGFRARIQPAAVSWRWLSLGAGYAENEVAAYLFAETHQSVSGGECKTGHLGRLLQGDTLAGLANTIREGRTVDVLMSEYVQVERNPYTHREHVARQDRRSKAERQAELDRYPETRQSLLLPYSEQPYSIWLCEECDGPMLQSSLADDAACASDACRQERKVEAEKLTHSNWGDEEELLCADAEPFALVR